MGNSKFFDIVDYVKVVHMADGFTWFKSMRETQTIYKGSGFDLQRGLKGILFGRVLIYDMGTNSGKADVELIQERNRGNFDIPESELSDWRQYMMEGGTSFREVTDVPKIRRIRKLSNHP